MNRARVTELLDEWPRLRDGWHPDQPRIANIDFWLIRNTLARQVRDVCTRWHAELGLGASVLDVGCGSQPYRPWIEHSGLRYTGIDWPASEFESDALDSLRWDLMKTPWPFADRSFDAVLCTELLEHVPDPLLILRECARVSRGGAALLLTAPMVWPEHEAPHDYFRFTRFGLLELCKRSGFEVEWIGPREGWNGTIAMLLGFWSRRNVSERWNLLTRAFVFPIVWVLAWRERRAQVNPEMLLTTGHTVLGRRMKGATEVGELDPHERSEPGSPA